jgi:phosphate-selective porin OprO and OprP
MMPNSPNLFAAFLGLSLTCVAQSPQAAPAKPERGLFSLTRQAKRPSIRIGKQFRADFRLSFQTDWRHYEPENATEEPLFDLHRSRVGVEGEFLKYFEYEFDYELGDTSFPWRDAYVNFRPARWFQVRGGKFKIPFNMNQLQGPTTLDFVYRSRIGALLAPAREIGGEIHGRLLDRGLNYQAGVFRHDGEVPYINDDTEPGGGTTYAARVTGTPLRLVPVPALLKSLTLGAAGTINNVDPGMKGLRGRTLGSETIYPQPGSRMFVNGERRRLGTELAWIPGPLAVKAEFADVREERKGQSIRGEDLPALLARGWYVSGTYVVTGQPYSDRSEPKEYFPLQGIGAIEVAARYEQIRFASRGGVGAPSRSTRASNVLPQSDRVWTWGVNWYLNRWTKVQANAIREKLEDVQRSPAPGRVRLWTVVVRVQYTL